MSIKVKIPPELEKRLEKEAAARNLDIDDLIIRLLEERYPPGPIQESNLREKQLLEAINAGMQSSDWKRYFELIEKRDAEILTDKEYRELIELNDVIEMAHARRLEYLVELAKLRGVSLERLMKELGIQPVSNDDD